MDTKEAKRLLVEHLEGFRSLSHDELARKIGVVESATVVGESRQHYDIKVHVFWDAVAGGDIRIHANIDDRSLFRWILPLTVSVLVAPGNGRCRER